MLSCILSQSKNKTDETQKQTPKSIPLAIMLILKKNSEREIKSEDSFDLPKIYVRIYITRIESFG
jgi:hypothetical protein